MKKKLCLLLALILTVGILAGCGSNSNEESKDGKTLVYGSNDYTAINPALYEHGEINSLIFLGLTTHNEKDEVAPGAAEEWSFDKKTNTYTFKLREGLKFHDGEPLTAEDVKFTIEAIMNPDNGSENASNFEDVTKVEAADDQTVKISMKAPNVAMLDYLTIGILPKHLLEGKDLAADEFNQKPVGAGPYKLTAWDKGQAITLEKNEDFYLGAPKIDKVIFKIVEDSDAKALQLQSGELDFAQITPKAMEEFEGKEDFKVYSMKTADYRGIMYNFNNPLFKNNRELPTALSYAIDRDAIIKSVLLGHGQTAYSPLQMGLYNNENVEKYAYNPAKTKKLLEKAGWKKGDDGIYAKKGQKLEFTINCSQGDQVRVDMANICAQNLNDIGAKVDVKTPAETDWAGQEAFLIGWGSPFDPDDHTYKVFGTDKGANYNGYSNAKVDKLLQQAREKEDQKERLPLYKDFQTELAKDPAYTFIAYIDAIYAGKANITGITKDTVLGHHGVGIFWNIYDWDIE
ncbi:ABC transporter substrate-binding protein [Anaerovorax odorimutans]|uniref:ABC transporter substrate-binding protein n=1 Tax=Anaerovorax odorimutans TaxID=109327 RepID=A0ABT1RNH7_9FIRM|nr:ABC transporter substrate-binding protein [Anaerovorax odorimutans]MCQ4636745.1 ABC transporter substrate-binding protein [Anaerovorax odorimutans]